MRLRVEVVVLCCAVAVGCGGHSSNAGKGPSAARTSKAEAGRVHRADLLAYLEIARASGTLRAKTAAAALGRAPAIANRTQIVDAAKTVLKVRPHDSGLITARGRMLAALKAALAARDDRRSQRAAAMGAIQATDGINRLLRHYAARNPDVQALIPD
jgi:hypothetical protein